MEYPILWIQDIDGSMGVFKDFKDFSICPKGAEKFYDNLYVITSDEETLKIKNAKRTGKRFPLNKFKFLMIFGEYDIEVKFDFYGNIKPLTLIELKDKVLSILENDITLWDADGRYGELITLIEKSNSIKQLVAIMKNRYFQEPFETK